MRNVINFNETWHFSKTQTTVPVSLEGEWEKLNLPHTWNGKDGQDGGNDYYRGKCFYAKEISKSDFDENNLIFLEINGANSSAEVYLDGEKIAIHHGGYSTFRVNLTDYLKEKSILAADTTLKLDVPLSKLINFGIVSNPEKEETERINYTLKKGEE